MRRVVVVAQDDRRPLAHGEAAQRDQQGVARDDVDGVDDEGSHVDHAGLVKLHWQQAAKASTFREMTTFEMIDLLHEMGPSPLSHRSLDANRLASDTDELLLDSQNGLLTVDAPRCQGLAGSQK